MADLALIKEASADPFIPLLTTVPAIFTPDTGAAFIERQLGRRVDGQGWSLAIHDVAADRAVGQIGLWVGSLTRGRAAVALH